MNIQEQTCTLEQAIKLKELGVLQNSIFHWRPAKSPNHKEEVATGWHSESIGSAFTCGELGLLLNGIIGPPDIVGSHYTEHFGHWVCFYQCFRNNELFDLNQEDGPTETQARADMLIWMIESKTCSIDEVNFWLSNG